jgi:hypothetical protein
MHPYKELPEQNFWRRGVTEKLYPDINFKPSVKFKLTALNNVATAGSCFAQHIAANLKNLGLNHFIAEKPPIILTMERASALGYGQFSARYGNIYTARQFRQMIEFAFDLRERITVAEESPTGWIDLLRPGVSSDAYESLHDLECDRAFHLDCIKKLFLEADCFIFTLGLTEAWYDVDSKIIFPACPGTKAGEFNSDKHRFVNFSTAEVVEDIRWCVEFIAQVNSQLKWIFTVSPVALSATATDRSVLVATAASKAILRAAAEEIFNLYEHCEYFPSLEITTSPPSFGQFLDADLRGISPRGVNLVMQIFRRSFVNSLPDMPANLISNEESREHQISLAIKAECEETLNDPELWHT